MFEEPIVILSTKTLETLIAVTFLLVIPAQIAAGANKVFRSQETNTIAFKDFMEKK